MTQLPSHADAVIHDWAAAAAPPPEYTVSQWADAERFLPETSGARGARWRTSTVPYLRGIMDAVHEAGVTTIALKKCSQVGGPLALDTPLATTTGWTTMGAIRVGDMVFDEQGVPTRVTAVSEVFHGRPCFAITWSDGATIVADASHRWFVESDLAIALNQPGLRYQSRGRVPTGLPRDYAGVLTTEQIAGSYQVGRRHRYAIPVTRPLVLPEADYPVDPYVLGVWLGDGHAYSVRVTQHVDDAQELVQHLRSCSLQPEIQPVPAAPTTVTIVLARPPARNAVACRRGHQYAVTGRTPQGYCAECHRQYSQKSQRHYPMDPVLPTSPWLGARLSALGVMRGSRAQLAHEKHIPPVYLRGSAPQRWALLQGLMDTDGTCSTTGRCELSTASPRLRDDALELLRSLGLKPSVYISRARVKRGTEYQCREGYRLSFVAYADQPVFRLARKLARLPKRTGRRTTETERRRIVEVRPVASVPVRCITVTSPRHLFLAGRALVPTHNSEALHNIVGYHIQHAPCPMLFVHPTAGVAEEWSKDRLADMIRSTPALRSVVREGRQPRGSHNAESTLALKVFPGGYLALGGANTPNTFARRSVRVAIGDDVDRFPAEVGEEGDPTDLLKNRTETYVDALHLFVSTPTLKGGRIDTLYERSDQRRYFVECPRCGRWDHITWSDEKHLRVVFDDRDPETARLECPSDEYGGCGAQLHEADRRAMVQQGEWRATATPKEVGLAGFHLPAMLSTIGTRTLPGLVERWLSAREKGRDSLRVFINTQMAEGWEERGTKMEPTLLATRRESYGEDIEIPAAAAALTCGVDVQDNRFELQVHAWGLGAERWLVDYRVVPGDPRQPETRAALLDALERKYRHASGHLLPIHATCIDSGYATDEIYDFVLAYQVRRIYATKGIGGRGGSTIVLKPSEVRYGKRKRPVRVYPVNVDDAKSDVMTALTLQAPGPGYLHFPLHLETVNEEYFAQLCAEHRETRHNRGGVATHQVWVQDRERNEALDTAVLCLAAYKLLNPNLRQMLSMLQTTAAPPTAPDLPPAPSGARRPEPAPAAPRPRRISHSPNLGR